MIRRASLAVLAAAFLCGPVAVAADIGILAPGPTGPKPALTAVGSVAPAHELGQSYLYLSVYNDSLVVRVEMAVGDVERVLGFGWDPETVGADAVRARVDSMRAYVEPRFELAAGGMPLAFRFREVGFMEVELTNYATLTYVLDDVAEVPDLIDVEFEVMFEVDREHRNLLVIEYNWKTSTFNNEANVSLIFSPTNRRQELDLSKSTVLRGFIGFIWLGVWHILIGFDHILFLLALVLPAVLIRREGEWEPVPNFRRGLIRIVTIVTFFTIAHSVTLSLAALDVVSLPSRLVESIIAASIALAAAANLTSKLDVREWAIAFAFGLFHGFGFATVLGDIGMGREYLVLSLLGFNVGVELGQIAIICLAFPVLFSLRRTSAYRWIRIGGSAILIAISLYWFLERAFAIDIPIVPAPLRSLLTALASTATG